MDFTRTSLSEVMILDLNRYLVKMYPLHIVDEQRRANLSPFKLEFKAQQKPMKIQVLNNLVKHNNRLNVNTTSYSTHPRSRHVLLVFANDSPTYERSFENSSWPTSICGLTFKVTLPSRNFNVPFYSSQSHSLRMAYRLDKTFDCSTISVECSSGKNRSILSLSAVSSQSGQVFK